MSLFNRLLSDRHAGLTPGDVAVNSRTCPGAHLWVQDNRSEPSLVSMKPAEVRQLIDALEPFAAPRTPEPPQPEPPLVGVEWLTGRAPAGEQLYEIVYSYNGCEPRRSCNTRTCGTYTQSEAARRAAAEQDHYSGLCNSYIYGIRPVSA